MAIYMIQQLTINHHLLVISAFYPHVFMVDIPDDVFLLAPQPNVTWLRLLDIGVAARVKNKKTTARPEILAILSTKHPM